METELVSAITLGLTCFYYKTMKKMKENEKYGNKCGGCWKFIKTAVP